MSFKRKKKKKKKEGEFKEKNLFSTSPNLIPLLLDRQSVGGGVEGVGGMPPGGLGCMHSGGQIPCAPATCQQGMGRGSFSNGSKQTRCGPVRP